MGSDLNTRYRNLYNGNIAHMGTLLPKIKGSGSWTGTNAALTRNITPEMLGNVYHYDQLNRITKHYAFDNYNAPTGSGTGNWQNGGPSMGTAEHHETFAYDGSGNITRLAGNSGTAPAAGGTTGQVGDGPTMDNLTYRYHTQSLTITLQQSGGGTVSINVLQNNKLYTVNEAIHSGAYLADIDDQGSFNSSASTMNTANNYGYDKLGNLVRDDAEEIAEIGWTSTGKIEFIKRSTGSKKPDLRYGYDATGTRLFKVVQPKQQSGATAGTRMSQEHWDTTWYIKDASGNAMATYTTSHQRLYTAQPANSTLLKKFTLDELHIYGSQRHGLLKSSQLLVQQEYSLVLGDVMLPDSVFPVQSEGMFSQIQSTEYGFTNYTEGEFTFTHGLKQFELSNHLGNVLVTIQDRKWGRQNAPQTPPQTNCDYYLSYVVTITDYYAFGSTITERSASFGGGYRFGFNNQEKESELGDYYAFEYRIHDARLGRFLSVDPLAPEYPWNSVYAFAENRVIDGIDLEGQEHGDYRYRTIKDAEGKTTVYLIKEQYLDDYLSCMHGKQLWLRPSDTKPGEYGGQGICYNSFKALKDAAYNFGSGKADFEEHYKVAQAQSQQSVENFIAANLAFTLMTGVDGAMTSQIAKRNVTKSISVGKINAPNPSIAKAGESPLAKRNAIAKQTENPLNFEIGNSPKPSGVPEIGLFAGKTSTKLPTQIHLFATNKNKTFTPQMSQIADEFGLSLNGAWNKQALPHLGRHPNAYHNFVLDGMQKARAGAGGSQVEFLNLFNQNVKQPVIQNPGLLRKSGW